MKTLILQKRLLRACVNGSKRLDLYLKEAASITRKQAQNMIDNGLVFVNSEKQTKHHRIIKTGDDISYEYQVKEKNTIEPFSKPIEIIYEDKSMIAVNKPPGMLVHPTKFCEPDTLVNVVKAKHPGATIHAVNRLDKDTSGIVVVALNSQKAKELSGLIMERKVYKEYLCLVHGKINKKGKIELNLSEGGHGAKSREVLIVGGKEAVTTYEPIEIFEKATLLKIVIKTGRTHQIRAHMQFINHAIVGDPVYGDAKQDNQILGNVSIEKRQLLHARRMSFILPLDKKEYIFEASVTKDFESVLKLLRCEI